MKTQHILLTTDLSVEAERAFGPVTELAKAQNARLTLLHVVPALTVAPHGAPLAPRITSPDTAEEVAQAKGQIATQVKALGPDVNVTVDVIAAEETGPAIADYAREHGADLIALSTHGRSGFRRWVLGSVAEQILRRASVPVLCFPRGDAD